MVPNTGDEVTQAWGKQACKELHNVRMLHLRRTRWGDEKSTLNFGRDNLKERHKDNIKWMKGVNSIYPAQGKEQWRALLTL
jgi:hypothetical protein